MKKLSFFLVLALSFLLTKCGPTTDDAINYNDRLIDIELNVIDKIDAVDNAFATYDPKLIEPAMNEAISEIEKAVKQVEEIGDFDGDSEFKDALSDLLNLFKSQLNNEYKEQLEIYKLPDDKYTETEENRYNELLNKMDEECTEAFRKFTDAQQKFADKWGFVLE